MSPIILQRSLDDLSDEIIDVAPKATNGRFRLVSCRAFLDPIKKLQVEEVSFDDMPKLRYAAISYPWKGIDTRPILPTFHVKGAEGGDPISIDVVRSACIAALQDDVNYIWLDRLCVLQEKARKDDKQTQIEHMHGVYRHCALCIVIPGGLQRLVSLDEETPWILRSWTLQEALSPSKVVVLVAWSLGSSRDGHVKEVTEKRSATIGLQRLINDTSEGFMEFVKEGSPEEVDLEKPTCFIRVNIFHRRSSHARALAAALAESNSQDFKDSAVWQCSQLRTSSRPVDMILSIMGMFGVTLTTKYEPQERLRATIDLAKEILEKGRSASWLGTSFRLPPCKYISTFSLFPETQVEGGALVETPSGPQDISEFVGGDSLSVETITAFGCLESPFRTRSTITAGAICLIPLTARYLSGKAGGIFEPGTELLPRGSMDDEGYLEIEVLSHPVRRCPEEPEAECLRGVNRTWWEACRSKDQDDHEFDHFAIFIGMYKKYHDRGRYAEFPKPGDGNVGKFMIVERHDTKLQRFHTVTFCLKRNIITLSKLEWVMRTFRIGGPEPLPRKGETMKQQVVDYEPKLASDMDLDGYELVEFGARLKARSQKEVEEFFKSHPEEDRFPHDGFMKSVWNEGKNQLEQGVTQVLEELTPDELKELEEYVPNSEELEELIQEELEELEELVPDSEELEELEELVQDSDELEELIQEELKELVSEEGCRIL